MQNILSIYVYIGSVSLQCPECSNNALVATCIVQSNVVAWLVNGVHVKSFSINSPIGETHRNGHTEIRLVSRHKSTLTISVVDASLQGMTIACADGVSGKREDCTLGKTEFIC